MISLKNKFGAFLQMAEMPFHIIYIYIEEKKEKFLRLFSEITRCT
jgi:hypothetical protein